MYLEEFIDEAEAALQDMYNEVLMQIMSIEAGVSRGVATVFGKNPPALPTWEDVRGKTNDSNAEIWWQKPKES